MKTLKTGINGGLPFVQEDLAFIQTAFKEALNGLFKKFEESGIDIVILSGVQLSTNNGITQSFTEGWLWIEGEVCFFPSQSVAIDTEYWLSTAITYDPAGSKVFETSGTNDVYQIREGQINSGAALPGGTISFMSVLNYAQAFEQIIGTSDWITFPDGDDDEYYGAGLTPLPAFRKYYKNIDGFVHLKGQKVVDDVSVPIDIDLGTLPVGYRPPDQIELMYTGYASNTSAVFSRIRIHTDGLITALQVTGNFTFELQNLPPFRTS